VREFSPEVPNACRSSLGRRARVTRPVIEAAWRHAVTEGCATTATMGVESRRGRDLPCHQLQERRRYVQARGWQATEFVDKGVSGAKDSRPALDNLVKDTKRRRFDTLVVWRLDRLGRNLKHLVGLLDDLQALGVAFVSLAACAGRS
jgi:hypothetical protein